MKGQRVRERTVRTDEGRRREGLELFTCGQKEKNVEISEQHFLFY